jgi:hypothetical protein
MVILMTVVRESQKLLYTCTVLSSAPTWIIRVQVLGGFGHCITLSSGFVFALKKS